MIRDRLTRLSLDPPDEDPEATEECKACGHDFPRSWLIDGVCESCSDSHFVCRSCGALCIRHRDTKRERSRRCVSCWAGMAEEAWELKRELRREDRQGGTAT